MKQKHIIFTHRGDQSYLELALRQAQKSNPDAIIHLIGDESNNHYDFVKHYNTSDYFDDAEIFAKHYVHRATNPYDFILFGFQIWFVMKDFMIKEGINECYHCDSDVLIYFDISEGWKDYKNYDFTVSTGVRNVLSSSGHTSFWNNQKGLIDFCNYLMGIYDGSDPINERRAISHYEDLQRRGKGGGICDMTILELYRRDFPNRVGDTTEIRKNSTYDDNINSAVNGATEFEMENRLKKIEWVSNLPFVTIKGSGEKIRLNMIHCQGDAKQFMNKIYNQEKLMFINKKDIYDFFTKNFWRKVIPAPIWTLLKKIFKKFLKQNQPLPFKVMTLSDIENLRKNQDIDRANKSLNKKGEIKRKIYLDCGAHVGEGLEQFMKMYEMDSSWHIYTFEPTKNLFEIIKSKFTGPNIHPINSAVWTEDGTITFHLSSLDSASSIIPDVADLAAATHNKRTVGRQKGPITDKTGDEYKKYKDSESQPAVTVTSIDLSKFIKDNFNYADYIVVKLDIEGAEYSVLRKLIKDNTIGYIDELYVEFHDRFVEGESEETNKSLISNSNAAGVRFHVWE